MCENKEDFYYLITYKISFFQRTTETVLWTNSSPTSSFSSQTVTLSDDITNYKYIKIEFRVSTSNSTSSHEIVSIEQFIANLDEDATTPKLSILCRSGNMYCRVITYVSSTSVLISNAWKLNDSNYNNSITIPLYIYGVK